MVDLPPLYPRHLWEPEGAPARVLWHIRQYYIHTFNDPFFTTPHDELPSWYILFTYLEVAVQIPMNWWIWRVFEVLDHGTTPGFELACVAYGVQVALTTLTCLFDVAYWDDAVYSVADKSTFVFGFYGPFVVIRKSPNSLLRTPEDHADDQLLTPPQL